MQINDDAKYTLEAELARALRLHDWTTGSATALALAQNEDDWSNREHYVALSQTYATLAQAEHARVANEIAIETLQRLSNMQTTQSVVADSVEAIARHTVQSQY